MKVLVTGGSGMVGKYLVAELLQHGHTVGIADIVPPKDSTATFHRTDVLDLAAVERTMSGYEAVIHAAGIPHPLNDPAERIFHVNVNGTFNVLEAAARTGVTKVVFTSSESTLGFAFMSNRHVPDYLPIDEHHPMRPQDPYGLSKVIGERICRTYSERYGLRTVCLREPWIWVPEAEQLPFYRTLVAEYPNWYKNLWTSVHVYDVAQAHRLALEQDLISRHEVFFITGPANWTGLDSRRLMEEFYPEVRSFAEGFSGPAPIISHAKAVSLLGYAPRYSVKDLLGP